MRLASQLVSATGAVHEIEAAAKEAEARNAKKVGSASMVNECGLMNECEDYERATSTRRKGSRRYAEKECAKRGRVRVF